MTKEEIEIEHGTRKMVYNHITAHPGVSFSVLKNVFGLSEGTIRYHLKYLEKDERIHSSLENGKRIYYPNLSITLGQKSSSDSAVMYKLTPVQEQILNTIKQFPNINQKSLINKTGLKRFIVTYNLNKLIDIGFVQKICSKRKVYYKLTTDELLRFEILKTLAIKLFKNEVDENTFQYLKNNSDL
jgi:predicted transcriptional regulator